MGSSCSQPELAAPALQASTSSEGPPLSAGDVAAAVRDMLSAARLPLDLDRQALMQETLGLRDQLKAAQEAAASASSVSTRAV